MKKLKDANTKYKDLLKMAKERIQSQEEELESLKAALKEVENRAPALVPSDDGSGTGSGTGGSGSGNDISSPYYSQSYDIPQSTMAMDQGIIAVTRVCQRIIVENDDDTDVSMAGSEYNNHNHSMNMNMSMNNSTHGNTTSSNNHNNAILSSSPTTIWALIEYEENLSDSTDALIAPSRRFQRWRKFHSEHSLADHVRHNNTGEPVHLPPYSLSPLQSQQIEDEARQAVAHITEEFRRFRVRSEVARKQSDATVRALQSNNVQSAQRVIEGEDIATELEQARSDHESLRVLRQEFAEQEAQWKEAYDSLLHENNALKSSGSEALLAAQWRRRYEVCYEEKEKITTALEMEREKSGQVVKERRKDDAGKYEAKYKDLKESFRLYRKKAKEIFEAQQQGEVAVSVFLFLCFGEVLFVCFFREKRSDACIHVECDRGVAHESLSKCQCLTCALLHL